MKKRSLTALVAVLLFLFALYPSAVRTQAADEVPDALDFRAVWVSTVLNLDYPLHATADPASLKLQADEILDGAKDLGMNAVILQVRPAADAFYDSAYFPWSVYLTGERDTAPENGFDPLEYWVEEAHKRGMELHAWINPYRITKNSGSDKITSLTQLPDGHPAKEHENWVISYGGDFYFDPGIPAVQQYIVDAAVEIVKKYDVDGIHLDDYFYPGADIDDAKTYEKYAKKGESLADWRRANVDALIKSLDEALHKADPTIRFGVSPFGIWANKASMAEGSDTRGGESYNQHYADTRKWVKLGWLDYIAPQIYWHIGHNLADYATLVDWWSETVNGTDVDLYIGHAAYRVGAEGENKAWATPAELVRQLSLNCKYDTVKGSIFFRYQFFADSPSMSDAITELYRSTVLSDPDREGVYDLAVTWPEKDITTSLSSYYVGGSSDITKPLFINGELILDRSENGFFGTLIQLQDGETTIVCSQGDTTVTRIITKQRSAANASKTYQTASLPDITEQTPSSNLYRTGNTNVTLSCTAPIGATVKATVGGKTYRLSPTERTAPDRETIYLTTYSYTLKLPKTDRALLDLGTVRYDMTYGAIKVRKYSGGVLGVYTDISKLQVSFTDQTVYGYMTASTSGGPYSEIDGSMTDTVTAIKGNFVRTASNLYVLMSDVVLSEKKTGDISVKSVSGKKQADGTYTVTVEHTGGTGWAKYDAETHTVVFSVSPASDPIQLQLSDDSIFASAKAEEKINRVTYTLELKDSYAMNGFYCTSENGKTTLHICPKRKVQSGAYPLRAHTIVIDAGHGGYESGALGLLGSELPEKDINLKNALALQRKLESLGATVIMTRTDDTRLSLEERVAVSRAAKPDLFISIHANSMSENTDLSSVRGFSVFYREMISESAAKTVFDASVKALDRANVGVHQSNLYVCRGGWCPAVIYETAFLPNPSDFDWLAGEHAPNELADAIANGIIDYFS